MSFASLRKGYEGVKAISDLIKVEVIFSYFGRICFCRSDNPEEMVRSMT
jgi:hypothetical protein